MTAVAPAPEADGRLLVRPPSLGRRRPVLSFVAVLGLLCGVLLGVGRSGVAHPQVRLRAAATFEGAAAYDLGNLGLRPVEVIAVEGATVHLAPSGFDLFDPDRPRVEELPGFAPFTLAGGSTRTLVVPVVDSLACPIEVPMLEVPVRFTVVVRSELGMERRLHAEALSLACG